jgi:CheY-like chemotaxis protein
MAMHATPLRILVIDDDEQVRETLSDIVRYLGHEIDVAASCEEGLALYGEIRHDAILTDLQMPRLTGWDVIERVRAVDPDARIALCTAMATNAIVEQARSLGIVLLRKPVHIEELQAAVRPRLCGASPLSLRLSDVVRRATEASSLRLAPITLA